MVLRIGFVKHWALDSTLLGQIPLICDFCQRAVFLFALAALLWEKIRSGWEMLRKTLSISNFVYSCCVVCFII